MSENDLGREEVVVHHPPVTTVITRTGGLISQVSETYPSGRIRTSTITRDGDGLVTQIAETLS